MRPIAIALALLGSLLLAGCAATGDSSSGAATAAPASASDSYVAPPAKSDAAKAAPAQAKAAAPAAAKEEPKKSAPPPSRIGDVRISLFVISKGETSKQYSGTYLMLVNPSWVTHKRSFQEPFWAVARPNIKIVDDEVMERLLSHIQDCGFYNMPETGKVDGEALKRPQVESIRYLAVTRDGVTRTVERERVSASGGLITKFVDIEFGVNQVWHSSQTFVTETKKQDWKDAFQSYLELRKASTSGAAGTGTDPAKGGATGGTGADGSK